MSAPDQNHLIVQATLVRDAVIRFNNAVIAAEKLGLRVVWKTGVDGELAIHEIIKRY